MGLHRSSMLFLIWQHKKRPFQGRVLTLGRLGVQATFNEMLSLLKSEGIEANPVPEVDHATNIPNWKNSEFSKFTSDRAFFRALAGCTVESMDVSSYEGADHVWDLNEAVPEQYIGQFDIIVDGGTMEHVFDVRQTLRNVSKMLKVGGRIIHYNPATNWTEHGFYQFSPTLYFDFYAINGFLEFECFLADQRGVDVTKQPWDFYRWNLNRKYCNIVSKTMLAVLFTATKGQEATDDKIPQQGYFQGHADGGKTGMPRKAIQANSPGILGLIKRLIPRFVKSIIWRHILKRDPARKPWNLEYVGRF